MSVPVIDPNQPTQLEQLEELVEQGKSQLAARIAIGVSEHGSAFHKGLPEESAKAVALFSITLANELGEYYKPKQLKKENFHG